MGLIFGLQVRSPVLIGGIAKPRRCWISAREHGIVADIEMIAAKDIDAAYERMLRAT